MTNTDKPTEDKPIDVEAVNRAIERCVYKEEKDCNPAEKSLRALEGKRCDASFLRFLHWVKLVEAPTYDSPGGVIPLQLWGHIKQIVVDLNDPKCRLLVILKARQVGASCIIAAYVLWHALSHKGSLSILFSKGEPEAVLLLKKCKDIYDQLPPFMKLSKGKNSDTELSFPFMNSSIVVKAATESAGVSYQASIVVCDEWQDHEYANKIWLNAKPCIDHGGQFIGIFTSPKPDLNKLCVNIFRQARKGNNSFKALFIPYWARPCNDKAWYDRKKKEVSVDELDGLSPELYMERTYPASEEEALSETSSISAFDHKILDEMVGDTRNPIHVDDTAIDPKVVHVYQNWNLGELYIAATDVSHGVGKDYSVTGIMNVRTGAVVADILSNSINENDFAFHSLQLMRHFHSPLWYIEDNDWGRVIINIAERDGYKNLGYRDPVKRDKLGWHTDEKTRTDLWGALLPAINTHQIQILNLDGLKQFYGVIRNVEKNGRIEAAKGLHDDYPIMVGICWARREDVKPPVYDYKPIQSLHFNRR